MDDDGGFLLLLLMHRKFGLERHLATTDAVKKQKRERRYDVLTVAASHVGYKSSFSFNSWFYK
jgi:hypothetical protein